MLDDIHKIDLRELSNIYDENNRDVFVSLYLNVENLDKKFIEERAKACQSVLQDGLMKENFEEYPKIREFSQKLGLNYLLDPIISPKDDGSKEVFSHRLTEKQLKEFYWEEFEKIEEFNTTQPCDAGFNFGAISADGYIYPCIQFPLKVGDATRDNFKDVWNNSYVLNRLREAVKAGKTGCKRCNLYSYCSRCMGLSFLETGSPFSSYSTACIIARIYKEFIDSYGKK